jgi:DNA ligase-1
MSNARAAASAKKKTQPQPQLKPSSPKKRKTLDHPQNPDKTLSSVQNPQTDESKKLINTPDSSNEPKSEPNSRSDSLLKVNESNKLRVEDKNTELKSKIVLLKKKAGDFKPEMVANWEKGERVPFIFVSLAFDLIANETGRIVITDIVCNMLRTVMDTTPEDLVAVVYLLANKVAPAHEGVELGIGEALIIKALAEACGRKEKEVKKQYKVIAFCVYVGGFVFC